MRQQEERALVLGAGAGSEDDDDVDPGLLTALANRAAANQATKAVATPGSVGGSQRGSQQTSQQVHLDVTRCQCIPSTQSLPTYSSRLFNHICSKLLPVYL